MPKLPWAYLGRSAQGRHSPEDYSTSDAAFAHLCVGGVCEITLKKAIDRGRGPRVLAILGNAGRYEDGPRLATRQVQQEVFILLIVAAMLHQRLIETVPPARAKPDGHRHGITSLFDPESHLHGL